MNVRAVSAVNYRLLFVLLLSGFIPTIYSTLRVHFLGSLPDTWAFSIAAQIAWLNVGYEVINEALLLPLVFLLGQVINEKTNEQFSQRFSGAAVVYLAVYSVMTLGVFSFSPWLISAMQHSPELLKDTTEYIRLEAVAILISSIAELFVLALVLKDAQKKLYAFIALKTALIMGLDTLFVSQLPFSLKLGINGIAYTNIVTNSILCTLALCWFYRQRVTSLSMVFRDTAWMRSWFRIGMKSGLESFVRNAAFIIMILQLVNQVKQAGTFWVTNQFIWGWLLLPVMALGQLVRQDAACSKGLTTTKVNAYLVLTGVIALVWLMSIPLWKGFIEHVMGISDYQNVYQLALLMLGFYVVFAFNNVIDSYFYGTGRTDLMLYQSLAVNTLFYGSAYIAYVQGMFIPNLQSIAMMFGMGMTCDALITFGLYLHVRRKEAHAEENAVSDELVPNA
ncbi:MATE family Na+-driven efflux transporter [Enterovibrio norvegicus]|uniref:MATE family Na+-driven efflux transporter n=1 Tax=Enterovibrio norvegicus TaxID=188144 RepID=UPI0024B1BF00|nr:MATE family Na+-driven efflux transporter [Enterovibrio norvegicus]